MNAESLSAESQALPDSISASKLRAALEGVGAYVQIVDFEWRLLYLNECCRELLRDLGYEVHDLIGKHYWDDLFPYPARLALTARLPTRDARARAD